MTEEIWKDISGYEGYYQVSNLGRVKSVPRVIPVTCSKTGEVLYERKIRERILKESPSGKYGHTFVTLWKGHVNSQPLVHHLVLEAFVASRPAGMEGCHNDGNGSNNRLDNLRWDTPKNNAADKKKHGTHLVGSKLQWAVLTEDIVATIRKEYKNGRTQQSLAGKYGVRQPAISRAISGKRWSHV